MGTAEGDRGLEGSSHAPPPPGPVRCLHVARGSPSISARPWPGASHQAGRAAPRVPLVPSAGSQSRLKAQASWSVLGGCPLSRRRVTRSRGPCVLGPPGSGWRLRGAQGATLAPGLRCSSSGPTSRSDASPPSASKTFLRLVGVFLLWRFWCCHPNCSPVARPLRSPDPALPVGEPRRSRVTGALKSCERGRDSRSPCSRKSICHAGSEVLQTNLLVKAAVTMTTKQQGASQRRQIDYVEG